MKRLDGAWHRNADRRRLRGHLNAPSSASSFLYKARNGFPTSSELLVRSIFARQPARLEKAPVEIRSIGSTPKDGTEPPVVVSENRGDNAANHETRVEETPE
jgi:hypothetical protein